LKDARNAPDLPLSAIAEGRKFSAILALVSSILSGISCVAVADTNLAAQIEDAVRQHLSQRLAQQAVRENWQGLRFTLRTVTLPTDLPLQACPHIPQIINTDGNASGLLRQRLTVRCDGLPGWPLNVTAQANVFAEALVATQTLERGQVLTAAMLERQEVNLGKQRRGVIADLDQVVGLSTKRRIRPQQVLNNDLLISPWLVRRGEKVVMHAESGEIHAAIEAVALEDGRLGMRVRVKNPSSGKIIDTQVTGPGEVSSTLKRPAN
jgi:flagella basal body P-ring formation protein FlgA